MLGRYGDSGTPDDNRLTKQIDATFLLYDSTKGESMNNLFAPWILAGLLFSGFAGSALAQSQAQGFNPDQAVRMMEQHWDKLMQEEDPEARQKLIQEHRKIMDETLDEAGVDRFHMGMMHGDNMNHHMDHLTDTIEMHHMQLDMMEQ